MINAKKKGNKGENEFAHWLEENGIKARRNPMSGGSIWKGDIANDFNYNIEVKTVKRINLQEAFKQTKRDAEKAINIPLLAIHFDGMPDKKWLIVMDCDDWLSEIQAKRVGTKETSMIPKWKLTKLKDDINNVLRDLSS